MYYGIMAKHKDQKKFLPLDYKEGKQVINIFYQSLWGDRKTVEKLVKELNQENPEYQFKLVERN